MGNGVTYIIAGVYPITIHKYTVEIKGRRWELLRSYINQGVEHFVATALVGSEKIDFVLKGKNALICEH